VSPLPLTVPKTDDSGPFARPISPFLEVGAYEALWLKQGTWFRQLAELFKQNPDAMPSDLVPSSEARACAEEALREFGARGVSRFGVRIHRMGDYPQRLREAAHPIELLYYQGTWELAETPSVAVIGTRKPSDEGVRRAQRIARALVERGYTVVSGLATGIDTAAHTAALDAGGRTIAVIGTPLGVVYPPENQSLQATIARDHLLISQVPILRYLQQKIPQKRLFFPERNKTMSALTKASIIVEAGETSGTLIQARAAIEQGRKLFILQSCFERGLSWPATYEQKGAVRVRDLSDLWDNLA
jgi:DNA processing protein